MTTKKPKPTTPKRILIFGASGTGKNWFGERLSKKSRIKFYDTDDLAWIKRFTVRRDYKEKCDMLKKICKKDKWMIATGATTYVSCAEKRADLIIILEAGFLRKSYRIIQRHFQKNASGEEYSPSNPLKLVYANYLDYRKGGKGRIYFDGLMKKYPGKVRVFGQGEKRRFLEAWGR